MSQTPTHDETNEKTRSVVDRRSGLERRDGEEADVLIDRRDAKPAKLGQKSPDGRRIGLERRRGAGIRRDDDRRSAEEGEMTDEQLQFVLAIEHYKKVNKKLFPTWTEVLEVIQQLGYRRVAEPTVDVPLAFRGGREETASEAAKAAKAA